MAGADRYMPCVLLTSVMVIDGWQSIVLGFDRYRHVREFATLWPQGVCGHGRVFSYLVCFAGGDGLEHSVDGTMRIRFRGSARDQTGRA